MVSNNAYNIDIEDLKKSDPVELMQAS